MAETFNFREDQVAVSRLAWDMAQWELHYLRGVFGTLIVDASLASTGGTATPTASSGSPF
jgi:hypothetical protein